MEQENIKKTQSVMKNLTDQTNKPVQWLKDQKIIKQLNLYKQVKG